MSDITKKKSSISGYDRLVVWLRRGLAATALALTALVVLWPTLRDKEVAFTLSYEDATPSSDQIRMINLQYVGTDLGNRRFEISARRGIQSSPEAPSIRLEGIRARIELDEGRETEVSSNGGTYLVDENILELDGGVVLTTSDGYRFSAGAASLDLEKYEMKSDAQISGSGPHGRFQADRFEIRVDERLLIFEGHIKVRLYPLGGAPGDGRGQSE